MTLDQAIQIFIQSVVFRRETSPQKAAEVLTAWNMIVEAAKANTQPKEQPKVS